MHPLLLSTSSFGTWALTVAGIAFVLALLAAVLVVVRAAWLRERIEAFFNQPPKPGKPAGPDHYYRPYWIKR